MELNDEISSEKSSSQNPAEYPVRQKDLEELEYRSNKSMAGKPIEEPEFVDETQTIKPKPVLGLSTALDPIALGKIGAATDSTLEKVSVQNETPIFDSTHEVILPDHKIEKTEAREVVQSELTSKLSGMDNELQTSNVADNALQEAAIETELDMQDAHNQLLSDMNASIRLQAMQETSSARNSCPGLNLSSEKDENFVERESQTEPISLPIVISENEFKAEPNLLLQKSIDLSETQNETIGDLTTLPEIPLDGKIPHSKDSSSQYQSISTTIFKNPKDIDGHSVGKTENGDGMDGEKVSPELDSRTLVSPMDQVERIIEDTPVNSPNNSNSKKLSVSATSFSSPPENFLDISMPVDLQPQRLGSEEKDSSFKPSPSISLPSPTKCNSLDEDTPRQTDSNSLEKLNEHNETDIDEKLIFDKKASSAPMLTEHLSLDELIESEKMTMDPEFEVDSSPIHSSSSDISTDSSPSDDSDDDDYEMLDPAEEARRLMHEDAGSGDDEMGKGNKVTSGPLRTLNEADEIIKKPNLIITADMNIEELGNVENLVENTVLIKAKTSGEFQVLEFDSVLCLENREVIGVIAETLGRVHQPYYSVRFATTAAISEAGISQGTRIFYVEQHSTCIFTQPLKAFKGSDASNLHDEEVGDDEIEFSDDEAEAEYKRKLKLTKQARRDTRQGPMDGFSRGARKGPVRNQKRPRQRSSNHNDTAFMDYDDPVSEDGPYTPLVRPSNLHEIMGQREAPLEKSDVHQKQDRGVRGGRGRAEQGKGEYRRGDYGPGGNNRGGYGRGRNDRGTRGQDRSRGGQGYKSNQGTRGNLSKTSYDSSNDDRRWEYQANQKPDHNSPQTPSSFEPHHVAQSQSFGPYPPNSNLQHSSPTHQYPMAPPNTYSSSVAYQNTPASGPNFYGQQYIQQQDLQPSIYYPPQSQPPAMYQQQQHIFQHPFPSPQPQQPPTYPQYQSHQSQSTGPSSPNIPPGAYINPAFFPIAPQSTSSINGNTHMPPEPVAAFRLAQDRLDLLWELSQDSRSP